MDTGQQTSITAPWSVALILAPKWLPSPDTLFICAGAIQYIYSQSPLFRHLLPQPCPVLRCSNISTAGFSEKSLLDETQQCSSRRASVWDFISSFSLLMCLEKWAIIEVDFLSVALLSLCMCSLHSKSWESIASCLIRKPKHSVEPVWQSELRQREWTHGPCDQSIENVIMSTVSPISKQGTGQTASGANCLHRCVCVCVHAWLSFVCLQLCVVPMSVNVFNQNQITREILQFVRLTFSDQISHAYYLSVCIFPLWVKKRKKKVKCVS